MIKPRFIPFVWKQVARRRVRTALTLTGVAMAMFLFSTVQSLQQAVHEATTASAGETTLIVYRENRYCPFTSRLPQHYEERLARVPGVVDVMPVQIVVNNCRTSLDVVTFRGVPPERMGGTFVNEMTLLDGSVQAWQARSDAALLGETLAKRRGLRVGDRFDAAGVTVSVAGIVRSDRAQDQNVAYVHLPFLQQSAGIRKLGYVTQFNVKVEDPTRLDVVARAIDSEFATDPDPTHTSTEQAFVGRAAGDVLRIVGFARWLGWGCLAAVLALVGNAIVLGVQDRVREHAVMATLGYDRGLIARLIVVEGLLVSLLGGALGAGVAALVIHLGRFSLSSEGFSINLTSGVAPTLTGLAIAAGLGVAAGLVPAWQASRREITQSFRAV